MKRHLKILMLLLVLALALGVSAAAADYDYTVRIYAGQQGTMVGGEDNGDVLVYHRAYGERVTFNLSQVQLKDGSKYYVKGLHESGKDIKEMMPSNFAVTRDQDYVVVYGILGDAVAYTIRYVDWRGNELAPSETYYGNVGDKPVVAYLYIDGYMPRYYNITGILSDNSADNVFTFVYVPIGGVRPEGPGVTVAGGRDETGGGQGGGGAGGGQSGAGGGQNGEGGQSGEGGEGAGEGIEEYEPITEPEEILDLSVPLANGTYGDRLTVGKILGSLSPEARMFSAIGVGAIALLLILFFLFRKKKKDEDEEGEGEPGTGQGSEAS